MNNKFFDQEKFACLMCGHIWILSSDKSITIEQHLRWIRDALKEHNEIKEKLK